MRVGSLVSVKTETVKPCTSSTLSGMLLEGSSYVVENVFTRRRLQWGADKIKPYCGGEEWLLELLDEELLPDPVDEQKPPRERRAPRRLIEEI